MTFFRLSLCFLALALAGTTAQAASCFESAGAGRAKQLAERCLEVSAATHPPCNVENACGLMVDEIRRGCRALGDDAPRFCERP